MDGVDTEVETLVAAGIEVEVATSVEKCTVSGAGLLSRIIRKATTAAAMISTTVIPDTKRRRPTMGLRVL